MKYLGFFFLLYFFTNLDMVKAQNKLDTAIQNFVSDDLLRGGSVSISLIDVKTGQLAGGYDSERRLSPASSLKVVATSTALAVLGADYRFKTELWYDGYIRSDSVLLGNLFIKGGGDPALGSDQIEGVPELDSLMDQWTEVIVKAGIKAIEGQIIAEASCFESNVNVPSWQWADIGNYYAAGVWGLNMHENFYYLDFLQREEVGAPVFVQSTRPSQLELELRSEVVTGPPGSGDNAYIYGGPYNYSRIVRGSIPPGTGVFTIKGSIPNPPLFSAEYLLRALQKKGVVTTGGATTGREAKRLTSLSFPGKQIHTTYSPPLIEIVKRANANSVNLYCEALVKAIGLQKKGEGGRKAGINTIIEYWSNKGVDMTGFFMEDGSGLSSRNAVSSFHLANILAHNYSDFDSGEVFVKTLPLIVVDPGDKRGWVYAKSGSMKRVSSYSGYVQDKTGRLLAFSILVNNFKGGGREMRSRIKDLMKDFL